MKRKDLLKEMKDSVGTKDPLIFFDKLTDVFNLLFDQIDLLEKKLQHVNVKSALAIHWEPKLALTMISKEVVSLRNLDKNTYAAEIAALKQAYTDDKVTQTYQEFCEFWETTLGWHPFLDYEST